MSKKPIYGMPTAGSSSDPRRPLGDLPIDAHPGAVKGDSPMLEPARRASQTLWDTWGKIRNAHETVSDRQRLAAAAQKAVERALSATDKALSALQKNRDVLEAKISSVVCPRSPDALAPEIRAHFRGTSSPFAEASKLLASGDRRSVAAILSAPAYLSGLDDEQHRVLRDLARQRFCPEEAQAVKDIDQAAGRVMMTAGHISETLAPRIREWRGSDAKALEGLANA